MNLLTRWPSTFKPVNKQNNLNVNYFKIPKKHRGRHAASAGLTIAANVAIATGPAVFCNKSYLLHYTVYKIFFSLRSQYFAKLP